METRFYVPKFITIEDRLAGLLTFRQLFALLGAFLITFFVFRSNQFLGLIVGLISFGFAVLTTFVYVNGKLFIFVIPNVLAQLFPQKYAWQKIEKKIYKEITLPKELEEEVVLPTIQPTKERLTQKPIEIEKTVEPIKIEKTVVNLEYEGVAPTIQEKVVVSLDKPLAEQVEEFNKIVHRHLRNPQNPYRLFPYIKFLQIYKQ